MNRKQSGMTLIGFLIVLAIAGVFLYVGMRLFPMYSQFYSVKQALAGMAAEPGINSKSPEAIKTLFFRRMQMSYADGIKKEYFKIERSGGGWLLKVDYEDRRPLVANLEVVGLFHAEQDTGGAPRAE